nr:putative disease resistance protein [Quercus suber]
MADSVVSFLLENVTQLLSQESKLLGGVEDQVRSLQNELSLINAFLKNTDGKRHDNELVKEVVSQIRDVAYEAEDVIDTFIMAVTKHRRKGKLGKLVHSYNRAISFHEVANKIESIKIINKEIHDNRNKYGIEIAESSGGETEAEVKLHKRRRYVEEDHVVGFGHDTEALVNQLIEDVKLSPMSKCRRISIHFANHPYISSSSNPRKSSNNRSVIGFQGVVGLESLLDEGYYLKWLCKSNKLVRVVELSNMAICCAIPKKIQNLFLLRYLSISSGLRPVIIPNSLCNLWNLETLDMRSSIIESLPKGLWKLLKLRHLYLNGPTSLPGTDNEEGLPNLQVLTGIALNHYTESLFAKARFPNLRKLGLCSSSVQESRLLILSLSSIHPMRHLQSLKDYKLRIKFIEPEN